MKLRIDEVSPCLAQLNPEHFRQILIHSWGACKIEEFIAIGERHWILGIDAIDDFCRDDDDRVRAGDP